MTQEKTEKTEKAEKAEKEGGSIGTKYFMYKDKKYNIHIGKRGGKYILVGMDKKKVYLTEKVEQQQKKLPKQSTKHTIITEDMVRKIFKAKEERDLNLFYKIAEVEPEEETLERKIQRQKKELLDNKIR